MFIYSMNKKFGRGNGRESGFLGRKNIFFVIFFRRVFYLVFLDFWYRGEV